MAAHYTPALRSVVTSNDDVPILAPNFTDLIPPETSPLPEFFAPQAAVGGKLEDAEDALLSGNYIAQEKLDGARYLLHKDMQGEVRIYSRVVSKKTGKPTIKTAQLRHLADEFTDTFPNGSVIDGEVVAPVVNSSSNLVTRATGASPEKAIAHQEAEGYLRYACFDILAYDGRVLTDLPLSERMNALADALLGRSPKSVYEDGEYRGDVPHKIYLVPYVPGEDRKRALYQTIVKRGGEGVILKDLTAPYYCGKRHKSWVKIKKERTFDVVFMGIQEAETVSVKSSGDVSVAKYAGQAGAIRMGMYFRNELGMLELREIGTTSGFDDAFRLDITENAEVYTGRVFEVCGQEQFATGAIRHPRWIGWRDDKAAEDCQYREGES